jgi:hypothetical protein
MTTATLKKAWDAVITTLNSQYEELDADFLDKVRQAVEVAYKPLFATGPAPKKKDRGVTAFNMFVSDFSAKHKDDAPVIVDGKQMTLFKLASTVWNKADAKIRAEFVAKAAAQNAEKGIVAVADRPKKPMNGYNCFVQEYKELHKTDVEGGKDLFKQASAEWGKKSDAEKLVYKQKADAINAAKGLGGPAVAAAAAAAAAKPTVVAAPVATEAAAPVAEKAARAPRGAKATAAKAEPAVATGGAPAAVPATAAAAPAKRAVKTKA